MENQDAMVLIFARNAFYRRLYQLALGAFALSLIVIGLLTWMLIYIVRNPSKPIYFATDPVSRLIEMIPLTQPNMTLEEVTAWAQAGVEAAYSYDYVNFRAELQNAQKYFTSYGWHNYMKALESSNNLVALTQRKIIVTARAIEPPTLLRQGVLSGAYAYRFQVPVLVTYSLPPYDSKSKFSNALQVNVLVQRQPILQSYKGLGILQIIGSVAVGGDQGSQEISRSPAG